jgi:hypothetical protein
LGYIFFETQTAKQEMKLDKIAKVVSLIAGTLTIFWVSYNIRKEFTANQNAKITGSTDNGVA